ncbi:hypothetical protein WJX73_007641 [Symbiochloris irregularis]|uniref:Kelch repeat-containing protein n=1 Tax=Symbiochloris irregularis TaxID=706552 RepID=A0AAW1NYH7_9CHLO
MGSGRDKRKKAKGSKTGQGAEKTARKTDKNEGKAARRAQRAAEGGEDDLDALLAKFKLDEAARNTVSVRQSSAPPSARLFASMSAISAQEFLLYGGEWYDGKQDKMRVFGDAFVYNVQQQTWKHILIPNSPSPRSAHQAVVHKGHLYMFGGELTSPNQEKFRHFRDLWRLDLASWQWEQLPARGGPNARSGHRMAVHKDSLLLFGGFHDGGKACTYYNDVWIFDIPTLQWASVKVGGGTGPSPRGGSQVVVHQDTLFVFWGHSVMVDPSDKSELERVHGDVWALDLQSCQWEHVKKAGMAPSPPRASFGLMRLKPGEQKAIAEEDASASAGPDDKASAQHRAAVQIQAMFRGYTVRKAYKTYKLGGKLSELLYSPAAAHGVDLTAASVKPRARANPMLTVCHHTLYLYGGVVEVAHTDITLDDLWGLDLNKLDGWVCVQPNTAGDDVFEEDPDWATDDSADQTDKKDGSQQEQNGDDSDTE